METGYGSVGDFSNAPSQSENAVRSVRATKFPKELRFAFCDGWDVNPSLYTKVVEFSNESENFYLYLRVRDLFKSVEELEELLEADPHHYFMLDVCSYDNIQRALKEKLPEGVRYEPSNEDHGVWVRVD